MDWKDIKPLRESEAKSIVKDYLIERGYQVEEIDPKEVPEGIKSPDFEVKWDKQTAFLCEIKTPSHNLDPIFKMYKWDTVFYKLRRFIRTASKQFSDFDPEHNTPWVIVFTSNHPQLNWTSFTHNVIGAVAFNGQVIRDYRDKQFVGQSNNDLLKIDMIIWFQVNYLNRKEVYQVKFFINKDNRFVEKMGVVSNTLKLKERT